MLPAGRIPRFLSIPAFPAFFLLSGCITAPTLDVTTAPTRAVSDLTDGTSNATTDLTEPIKNFTSSTTPGSLFSGDGMVRPDQQVLAFTVYTYDNLREDIARGSGEYLSSFATLVGVPGPGQTEFNRYAQEHYGYLYAEDIQPIESVHRLIQTLTPSSS